MLIHAAGSGVGTAAAQIAKQLGATVLGTSRSGDKLARALVYGLDIGIDTTQTPFREAVGEPVQVVLDVLGGPALADNLAVLAPRGRLILLGFLAGSETDADLGPILRKRLEIIGTMMRTRGLEERIPLVREFGTRMLPLFETRIGAGGRASAGAGTNLPHDSTGGRASGPRGQCDLRQDRGDLVTKSRAASSQRHSLPECTGTIASMDVIDGVLEISGAAGQLGRGAVHTVCRLFVLRAASLPRRPSARP